MISYELYKVIHLTGVIVLFSVLGGAMVHAMNGGLAATNTARRLITILHGTGLLLILVAGFGLVARLDLMGGGLPLWVLGKLLIWLVAGVLLTVPRRKPHLARPILLLGLPVLAATAAWLAVYKPGN
jgi:hypothetical protein